MSYLNADDYLVWVGAAGAAVADHHVIAGQVGTSFQMSRGKIDQTVKSDDYEASRPGLASFNLSSDVRPKLPDANGYTLVESAWKAKTLLSVQIRKAGSAGVDADIVFAISSYVASISPDFPAKADVPSKIEWMPTGAPTVNTLA